MATELQVGLNLVYRGMPHTIVSRLPTGNYQLQNQVTKKFIDFSALQIAIHIDDNNMKLLPSVKNFLDVQIDDINLLPPKQKNELDRRHKYVENVLKDTYQNKNVEAFRKSIEDTGKDIGDFKTPSLATVYRWIDRYVSYNREHSSLLRKDFSLKQTFRFGKREKQIIDCTYNTEYLKPERPKGNYLYEKIGEAIRDENELIDQQNKDPNYPKTSKLKLPSKRTIYRYIKHADEFTKELKRYGEKAAIAEYAVGNPYAKPKKILERLEIDYVTLDLVVRHDVNFKILRRLYAIFSIDCFSRAICGFYITSSPPGINSILRCLRRSIKTKAYVQKLYPQIKNPWTQFGIPDMVVADNGDGFPSKDVKAACKAVGIRTIMFSPPGYPWERGKVERFFRTMNMDLLHRLPGTTRSNVEDKGSYDSEANAIIRVSTLVKIMHVWIDKYNHKFNEGIKDVPADLWDENAREFPPVPLENPEKLAVFIGKTKCKQLRKNGLLFKGLQYNNNELRELYKQFGKRDIEFKVDEDDISRIFPIHPEEPRYFCVPCLDQEYSKNRSLYQHEKTMALNNAKRRKNTIDNLILANKEIDHAVRQDAEEFKSYTRAMQRWEGIQQKDEEGNSENVVSIIVNNGMEAAQEIPAQLGEPKSSKKQIYNKQKHSLENKGEKKVAENPDIINSFEPPNSNKDAQGWHKGYRRRYRV
jgi:putative transposase